VRFLDRSDAGRQLAVRLEHLRGQDVVVLGLPRGGVPVAAELARALGVPLDVVVVRKVGVPFQPELAMAAVGEGGALVVDQRVLAMTGVPPEQLAEAEVTARRELADRVQRFRGERSALPLAGRIAVLVDDGIATGSTARAAAAVVRELGAARVVLAVPVAARATARRLAHEVDELICLHTPRDFLAVGRFYDDFSPPTDDEVVALLTG
jgi:putative phosphoribosyl transferase